MKSSACCLSFAILSLSIASAAAAEHVVCATADQSEACKRVEAATKEVKCVQVVDSVDCTRKILDGKAHFGVFTPEEALLASYFARDDANVIAEVRHPERSQSEFGFETVVVVHRNFTGGLSALAGTTYCHPGFMQGRYWSDRVLKYFESKVLAHFGGVGDAAAVAKREEELHRLSTVFKSACRPGVWSVSDRWDKKLKRDYGSLCANCDFPSTCSYRSEVYNERFASLKCLTEKGGDVAYAALEYVQQYFNITSDASPDPEEYNFLCEDGTTRPLTATPCSWIKQPWTSIVAARSHAKDITDFLQRTLTEDLPPSRWKLALRKILLDGDRKAVYMQPNLKLVDYVQKGRAVPTVDPNARTMDWCTTNEKEKEKCEYMARAALVYGLPTNIRCSRAESKIECLRRIRDKKSDVTVINTQLGYTARRAYNLTAAVFVETENKGNYYGVVVFKGKAIKRFKDLKGKKACFPVYNGLGWLSSARKLRKMRLVPSKACSDSRAVWTFFSEACAPGAKSPDMNKYSESTPSRLCRGCRSNGTEVNCEADPGNPYYCEPGALRCLNNGDGDVAFLDFNAAKDFLDSDASGGDFNADDFKILCNGETIETFRLDNPQQCAISQLNGEEVVMRNDLSVDDKRDNVLTLVELDDLFGHSLKQYSPVFKMFEAFEGVPGVLFKDTAVALIGVYDTQNEYVNNYLELQKEMMECHGENAAVAGTYISVSLLLIASAYLLFDGNA